MKRKRSWPRDQDTTPFTAVLDEFCRATGSYCAALVDPEGETVDYGGHGDPFEIRILAAELRLLLQHAEQSPSFQSLQELTVRGKRKSFFIYALPEGYAFVARLPRYSSRVSERPLSLVLRGLCEEAGFDLLGLRGKRISTFPQGLWRRVEVDEEEGARRRPCRVATDRGVAEVEIMGRLASSFPSARKEDGFRVRFSSGQEGTLVREPLGFWYLEEDP